MSAFGHIINLLSFVYALAIAHLLLTVAGIVRGWERVRFSWFHAYWMLNALTVIVVDWISFWDMRNLASWSIGLVFITLGIAFLDYLQAALVCPEIAAEGPIDLQAFHTAGAPLHRSLRAFRHQRVDREFRPGRHIQHYAMDDAKFRRRAAADDRARRNDLAQTMDRYRRANTVERDLDILFRRSAGRAEIKGGVSS